jgi:hypothetical protein
MARRMLSSTSTKRTTQISEMSKQMLRNLSDIDSRTLQRYRERPDEFIENLISPYTLTPYVLVEAERQFIRRAFELDDDGRLRYPLMLYGAPKKSRKSELASLIIIAMILLHGSRYAEGFIVSNSLQQSQDRCFANCVRITKATPWLADEVVVSSDEIYFLSTQSTIKAVAQNPRAHHGGHPTISIFDEMHAARSGDRGMWDAMIPTPARKISCRLAISHAGVADPDHLLYQLYTRTQELPLIGKDLRAGSGMLCYWGHECLHTWQTQKWLDEARRDVMPADFRFMYENEFVPAQAAFITPEMYARSEKQTAPPPSDTKLQLFVGVDAAPLRDNTALFGVTPEGDDGDLRLVCHKVYVPSPDHPLDFEATIEATLLDWSKRYSIRLVLVDPSWMIATNQRLRKLGLKIEELTQPENRELPQLIYDLFRTERLHLYPDAELRKTITGTTFEETNAGLRFAKHQTIKKDATVALATACFAAQRGMGKPSSRWDIWDPPPPPIKPELVPLTAGQLELLGQRHFSERQLCLTEIAASVVPAGKRDQFIEGIVHCLMPEPSDTAVNAVIDEQLRQLSTDPYSRELRSLREEAADNGFHRKLQQQQPESAVRAYADGRWHESTKYQQQQAQPAESPADDNLRSLYQAVTLASVWGFGGDQREKMFWRRVRG